MPECAKHPSLIGQLVFIIGGATASEEQPDAGSLFIFQTNITGIADPSFLPTCATRHAINSDLS